MLASLPTAYRAADLCVSAAPDSGATAAPRCGNPNADDPYAPPPAVAEFRLFPDTIGTPKSPGDIGTLDRLELWWNHDVLSKF